MLNIKQFWNKFKIWIGLLVAGVTLSFLVLRKHVGDGLKDQREQFNKEEDVKASAEIKLKEETKVLEEKKQEEIKDLEDDNKQKFKEAVEKAKEEKKRLQKEAERDPQGFKIELRKELGAKEKKKKGRRK